MWYITVTKFLKFAHSFGNQADKMFYQKYITFEKILLRKKLNIYRKHYSSVLYFSAMWCKHASNCCQFI